MKAKWFITFIVLASMLGWVAVTVPAANGAGDGKSRGSGGSGGVQLQSHSGMSIHHARLGDPASDFKVANIVILNNTGLPDSEVYFAIRNTIDVPNTETNCEPDMTSLFQWYGGTDSVHPTQITNDYYTKDSYYHQYMSLQDMRGYVASQATSSTSTVQNFHADWQNATYSLLCKNYPSSDPAPPIAGQFPTISLGLWGACTLDATMKQFAGRMMITTAKPTPTDVANGFREPPPSSSYSPFLLIEGSINPTDKGTYPIGSDQYPVNASNFDLSYVDQFSMGANMELWGLNNSAYGPLPSNSYHTGEGLKMSENCSSIFYQNKSILTTKSSSLSGANNYISWSLSPFNPANDTPQLKPFIDYLINETTTSTARVPVLKVASYPGFNFAGSAGFTDPAFQENSYTTTKEYNFASYFVKVDSDGKWWTTIKNQFNADTGLLDTLPTTPPTLITPTDDTSGEWMIMVGRMSNGANTQKLVNTNTSPNQPGFSYPTLTNSGTGPVSVQFDSYISMNMTREGGIACVPVVQTNGLATCPSSGTCLCDPARPSMFNTLYGTGPDCNISTSTSESLGINFGMQVEEFTLSKFDLAAGLTTSTSSGTLDVILVRVNTNKSETNLNKLTLTLPYSEDVGLASNVQGQTSLFRNMPLTINWQTGKCTFNTTSLDTKCYLPDNAGGWTLISTPVPQEWITNLNLSANSANSGYRLYLSGMNMTVALSNGNPTGAAGSVIVPFVTGPDNNNYYSTELTDLTCSGNKWLACTITAVPAESAATTDLHVLAVPKYNLISYSNGILGNNPSYEFLRYNTQTSVWDTSTSTDTDNPWYGGISKAIVNDVSGRIAGDAMALFSFGVVNSTSLGNQFPNINWPDPPFPDKSTAIGALTSGQYFNLMSKQDPTNPNIVLPAGKNLATTPNIPPNNILSYDSYFDVGFNQCHSNNYFTGLGDRFGGSINPNPGFSMDVQTGGSSGSALLGFVPGSPLAQQPVIVITLHPIHRETTWDTIDSDLDNDFDTDSTDLSLMLLAMSVYPPAPETGSEDLNKDGVLDNTDLGLVFLHFGD